MKDKSIKKRSSKEEQLMHYVHRKLLASADAVITEDLNAIINWTTSHGGIPVKATYITKNKVVIELIEISFGENDHQFFKPVAWEDWYAVFKKEQLKFIFIQPTEPGKTHWFYKLSR